MKRTFIKINNITDLSRFVLEASKVKGDIFVYKGRYCIDGKSIMGMISLRVSDGCIIEYPNDAEKFEKFLKKFEM